LDFGFWITKLTGARFQNPKPKIQNQLTPFGWSLIVNRHRPFARRAATTRRPPFVRIRDRNPCSRFRGMRFG
jgi:hypothetical protein